MIQLDGSHGEGGGSILRQALALSMLTGKEFTIKNVRANRESPGLAAQHLAGLNAAVEVCGAASWGNSLGSTEVYFKPGELKPGNYKFEIGTAGSMTLLLQSLLLACAFSKKKFSFTLTGGTDVAWSQPFDYFKHVFLPQLRRYADVDASLFRRGYYPAGGGEVKVSINSKYSSDDYLHPIILSSRHQLLQIRGVSHASFDLENARVAERQAEGAKLKLKALNVPMSISHEYAKAQSTGSGLALWAVFGGEEIDFDNPVVLGADALGERGKKADAVGLEAADSLLKLVESDACVDEHLADQLIPYLAVAGGVIKTNKITNHVLSNIRVCEEFLGSKFEVKDCVISCNVLHDQ